MRLLQFSRLEEEEENRSTIRSRELSGRPFRGGVCRTQVLTLKKRVRMSPRFLSL
jgi:hypothetical protein